LLFFVDFCFSVGQSIFNLANTDLVTTSSSSSKAGELGGKSSLSPASAQNTQLLRTR